MSRDNEGFLGRWSRRKAQARHDPDPPQRLEAEGEQTRPDARAPEDVPDDAIASPGSAPSSPPGTRLPPAGSPLPAGKELAAPGEPSPLPTLEDLAALTPQSDFSSFMQPGVGRDVKLAALKKLFSDPHHNVMDGLDIYIDDYSSPQPLPASALKKMVSARVLALVDDEPEPTAPQHVTASAQQGDAAQPAAADTPAPAAEDANAPGDATDGSVLESDASADPACDGQAQFDFSEPESKT